MKFPLSLRVLLFLLLAFTLNASAAQPLRQGLQISLATSGYEFQAATVGANATPFTANVLLVNLSRQGIPFVFPDPTSAAIHFKFRILNSAGTELWESDSDIVSAQVATPATLGRGRVWKRQAAIPLTVGGQALPVGSYTLEATLAGTPSIKATSIFAIVAPGTAADTGITGTVYRSTLVAVPLTTIESNSLVGPIGARAALQITEIRQPNVSYDHPAFTWNGFTENDGTYKVGTPQGSFQVTATLDTIILSTTATAASSSWVIINPPITFPISSRTAIVDVQRGSYTQQSFYLGRGRLTPTDTGIRGTVFGARGMDDPTAVAAPLAGASVVITPFYTDFTPLNASAAAAKSTTNLTIFPIGLNPGWVGLTDADGKFSANLFAGSYRIKVYSIGTGASSTLLASTLATVSAGQFTVVELHQSDIATINFGTTIYSVESASIKSSTATELVIESSGTVTSGGWSNPRLIARPSTNAAVLDFDFVADPPTGVATQALVSGRLGTVTINNPAAVTTVRVHASTNQQELTVTH